MSRFDLVLKGGTIVHGQRTPRFAGDIAITGGRIAQIGSVSMRKRSASSTLAI